MQYLYTLSLFTILLITGCKDSIRIIDDVYECTTVKVDGYTYNVEAFTGLGTIGYVKNGLTPHSDCTPAIIESYSGTTHYHYYQHGQPANSKEGVSSLSFWRSTSGQSMLNATRLKNNGVITREDGTLYRIQLMEWQEWFGDVLAQNAFNGSLEHSVLIEVGENSKERRWDDNAQQWQCIYRNNGSIVEISDLCIEEALSDELHLGLSIPSEPYLEQLEKSKRRYQTDEDKLIRDLNDYFGDWY
ncbi:hypothetical protein ACPV5L_07575 [Vibrio astriarenae]